MDNIKTFFHKLNEYYCTLILSYSINLTSPISHFIINRVSTLSLSQCERYYYRFIWVIL